MGANTVQCRYTGTKRRHLKFFLTKAKFEFKSEYLYEIEAY